MLITFCILSGTIAKIGQHESFQLLSKYLDEAVTVAVLLPDNYDSTNNRYPVVFLLHGFGGNHDSWLSRCKIDKLIDSLHIADGLNDCIYVLPDAKKSYYINNYDSSYNYMDFFTTELVPFIDSKYRTWSLPKGRALMGMSMGGYGSIMLGVKYPEEFGVVVAMSAAVRTEEIFLSLSDKSYNKLFIGVYGPREDDRDSASIHWRENSPYYLIKGSNADQYKELSWYLDCGFDDSLLPSNEAFHKLLVEHKIPHEYHVRPGSHNWDFWYDSSVLGLKFIDKSFQEKKGSDL